MPGDILTIGHSTHSPELFLSLLRRHSAGCVVDVRSSPFSRWNPQYNREELQRALRAAGMEYVFLGQELGGRCDDRECYVDGRVQYDRVARTAPYLAGLDRLRETAPGLTRVLLCAEKDPLDCHRGLLIARSLEQDGAEVVHIHPDGRLEAHAEAVNRLRRLHQLPDFDLFLSQEEIISEAYRRQQDQVAFTLEPAGEAGSPAWPASPAGTTTR